MFNSIWYDLLLKPPLTPPDWVFTLVWGALYVTLVLSLFLHIKSGGLKKNINGLLLSIIQLCFSFLWPYTFFYCEKLGLALIVAILMFVFAICMIKSFYKYNKVSSYILIPYLIWLAFAICLNAGIFYLNS